MRGASKKLDFSTLGYYRVAAVSPPLALGEPGRNAETLLRFAQTAAKQSASLTVFPELSLVGYTIDDFLHNDELLRQTREALRSLVKKSENLEMVLVVGAPYSAPDGRLYNVAWVIAKGRLLGAVPKSFLPNYKEFYEARWFASGREVDLRVEDPELGKFRLASRQLFQIGEMRFGVELCEDFFAAHKPSLNHALAGASVVVNLSASNDLIAKASWREDKVRVHSGDLHLGYVYASSGPFESSKDAVFGGHLMIAENGVLLQQSRRFSFEGDMVMSDLDIAKLQHDRRVNVTLSSEPAPSGYGLPVPTLVKPQLSRLARTYSPTPFIPGDEASLAARAQEMIEILATGLARRMLAARAKHLVIGLSGGLDSTLALLISLEAVKKLGKNAKSVIGITMPGLGTTDHTLQSAEKLAKEAGILLEKRSIVKAVEQHFNDIDHDPRIENITFENAQARERTQILFDRANEDTINGIVVGTGDMSELWLGWATYNGDIMSSYGVNAGVPKTLVKHLVGWYARTVAEGKLQAVLETVLETPISPELRRPGKKGEIQQKTEEVIGPYLVHDFFLFHHLRNGAGPRKLFAIAELTFAEQFRAAELKRWLKIFFQRGYQNQFKRTALPGGPKVGSVSLSPRADLRLPDEMTPQWILEELESL